MKPKQNPGKEKPDEAKEEAPDTLGGTDGDDDDRDLGPAEVVADPDRRPAEQGGEDDELI